MLPRRAHAPSGNSQSDVEESATVRIGERGISLGAAACLLLALVCAACRRFYRQTRRLRRPQAGQREAAPAASAAVDPRFRSPKATVRWFLAAINAAEENPDRLDDATACLDHVGSACRDSHDAGRLGL